MDKKDAISRLIQKNRAFFSYLLSLDEKEREPERAIQLASLAARFAADYPIGCLSSTRLETLLLKYAKDLPRPAPEEAKPRSFLHVFTQAMSMGGHTRMAERWVQNRKDKDEIHHLALTMPFSGELPLLIQEAFPSPSVFSPSSSSYLERARFLRNLAMGYERIILYHHMDDPVPILAFGTADFPRPVFIYNHADHCFWIGVSIADLVLELSTRGSEFSRTKRGVIHHKILPIPLKELEPLHLSKEESRKKLGLPQDKKVILSLGATHRYWNRGDKNFQKLMLDLLKARDDIFFLMLGATSKKKYWAAIRNSPFKERVLFHPQVPREELEDFLFAADLYLEAYPKGSGTGSMEVVLYKIPAVLIRNDFAQFDSYRDFCTPFEEVLSQVLNILDKGIPEYVLEERRKAIIDHHYPHAWNQRLEEILAKAPSRHQIHPFQEPPCEIDELSQILALNQKKYSSFFRNPLFQSLPFFLKIRIRSNGLFKGIF
ncbi:MAG: hypothetical protein D6785_16635 [Planctomycetota bacterium]|nr:MAG: hypothetical protein D6785_16635 [Planctomycetota bacterium]